MKSCTTILLCVLVLAVLTVASQAGPAYYGFTGLMFTPTADTLGKSELNFGVGAITRDSNTSSYWSGNVGLFDGLEVGALLLDRESGDSSTYVNTKLRLLKETEKTPALAIGAIDLFDETSFSSYFALSKTLSFGEQTFLQPRFTVGAGSDWPDGFFASVTTLANERIELMLEYDSANLNFGVNYLATKGLQVHAGLLDGDLLGLGLRYSSGF